MEEGHFPHGECEFHGCPNAGYPVVVELTPELGDPPHLEPSRHERVACLPHTELLVKWARAHEKPKSKWRLPWRR